MSSVPTASRLSLVCWSPRGTLSTLCSYTGDYLVFVVLKMLDTGIHTYTAMHTRTQQYQQQHVVFLCPTHTPHAHPPYTSAHLLTNQ